MIKLLRIVFLGTILLCSACTTTKLWEATDPTNLVLIEADKTSEAELTKLGVKYTVIDSPSWKGYGVEKSTLRKAIDLQLRLVGTCPAFVIDVAGTVVGAVACNPEFLGFLLECLATEIN